MNTVCGHSRLFSFNITFLFIVESVEFKDIKALGNAVGNVLKSFIRKSWTGFKKDVRRDGFYLSRFTTIGLFKSFVHR